MTGRTRADLGLAGQDVEGPRASQLFRLFTASMEAAAALKTLISVSSWTSRLAGALVRIQVRQFSKGPVLRAFLLPTFS
jgi:hypothetical protein